LNYGNIVFDGANKVWRITCPPHVSMRLKRHFPSIPKGSAGTHEISDTLENCRDLRWFLQRFPMDSDYLERLTVRAQQHRERLSLVDKIQAGTYEAPVFDMAKPPREYQKLAATMCMARGGLLVADDVGLGKAQPLDAKVLTPSGWSCMGALSVGDEVVDPDGGVGVVTGTFDRGIRDSWRVTTSDGAQTECCDEHLWLVQTANDRARDSSRILQLKDFKDKLTRNRPRDNWFIPIGKVDYGKKRLARKAERWRPNIMARAVKSVTPVGPKPMRCIAVSTKRNLYFTDDYIVTHNTIVGISTFCAGWTLPAIVVTLNGPMLQQWADRVDEFMPRLNWHILKKGTPYDIRGRKSGVLPDVVIMNYSKLAGWCETLVALGFKSLIWDEVQEMRHRDTDKFRAAQFLVRNMKMIMSLSATPIFNYGGEAYNILDMTFPDQVGTPEEFGETWCGGGSSEKAIIQDTKAFNSYLRENGMMVRRSRADVGRELPPRQTIVHYVESDREAFDKATASCDEMARILLSTAKMEKGVKMRAGGELDAMLRQATGIGKAPYVAEFVRLILESGEKVVLYGWHHAVYEIWRERLKDFKPVCVTGHESPKQKLASLKAFMEGDSQLIIISLRAGAGLDGLQHVCHIVVFGELDWSPGCYVQASGRVDRDGQPLSVLIYYLLSTEGSDPIVAEVNGIKKNQVDGMVGIDTDVIEELQTDGGHIMKLAEDYLAKRAHSKPRHAA